MGQGEVEPALDAADARGRLTREAEPVPPELLTVSFPVAIRGYSREAVDSHIQRLNRLIAELEMNRSPRSAVRHALDRVGEQTSGILRQARAAAEEILAGAREEADEITDRAAAEARELVVDASADADQTRTEAAELLRRSRVEAEELLAAARQEAERIEARTRAEADDLRTRLEEELDARRTEAESAMLELREDTDVVWEERRELLTEIRQFADQAKALATEAVERHPDADVTPADEGGPLPDEDTRVTQAAEDSQQDGG
jgi:cell division septum initiation protein DivIVA